MRSLIYINTQEWLRLKFLQVVFFLSFVYVCISYLLGSLSFTEQARIKFDLGLAGLEIATLLVACFISTHALDRDIERKTFQVLLARPISRWHLLVGYLGSIAILNAILILFLSVTMAVFFELENYGLNLFIIALTILIKSVLVGSLGIMLSTLARPMFGLVMVFSYWILVYSVPDIQYFIQKTESSFLEAAGNVLAFMLPKFYLFNWKSHHYLKIGFAGNDIAWSWLHCFGWIFLFVFISSLLIRRKDIV